MLETFQNKSQSNKSVLTKPTSKSHLITAIFMFKVGFSEIKCAFFKKSFSINVGEIQRPSMMV